MIEVSYPSLEELNVGKFLLNKQIYTKYYIMLQ